MYGCEILVSLGKERKKMIAEEMDNFYRIIRNKRIARVASPHQGVGHPYPV